MSDNDTTYQMVPSSRVVPVRPVYSTAPPVVSGAVSPSALTAGPTLEVILKNAVNDAVRQFQINTADEYRRGIANGLLFAQATLRGLCPVYLQPAPKSAQNQVLPTPQPPAPASPVAGDPMGTTIARALRRSK